MYIYMLKGELQQSDDVHSSEIAALIYMHTIHAYIHTYIQIHTHTHVQMYGAPVNEAMPLMNAIATPNLGHVYHVWVNGTWHQNEWG